MPRWVLACNDMWTNNGQVNKGEGQLKSQVSGDALASPGLGLGLALREGWVDACPESWLSLMWESVMHCRWQHVPDVLLPRGDGASLRGNLGKPEEDEQHDFSVVTGEMDLLAIRFHAREHSHVFTWFRHVNTPMRVVAHRSRTRLICQVTEVQPHCWAVKHANHAHFFLLCTVHCSQITQRTHLHWVLLSDAWLTNSHRYSGTHPPFFLGHVHTWCPSTVPEHDYRWALLWTHRFFQGPTPEFVHGVHARVQGRDLVLRH